MTNEDLYKVKQGIEKCSALVNVADINFAYIISKIDSEVSAELKVIEKARKPESEEYKELMKAWKQIDLDHAIEKDDGTYQNVNGNLIIRNPKEHQAKVDELKGKYKDTLAEAEKNNKEFENFLSQECRVAITKLPKSCIPAQISVEQMRLLFPVIIEGESK